MKKTELLAPAGNLSCGITAVDNGADAVYAGLGKFNAREMGENFSLDDMSRLSAYMKRKNKKLYITLNTLVKEGELEPFYNSVVQAASVEPDAFIVQDLGVMQVLKDYFPEIPVHASTQMGIHNSAGVQAAADLGIERVILERQVTMDELKIISEKSPVELEVFVHGALCCSLSGCCLFSSWLGGYSGNRGKCKQPCRRRYYKQDKAGGAGFYLSTMDLFTADLVPQLTDMGIASLKIEGRLKREDYVANTVKAYRAVLDAAAEDRRKAVSEAKRLLANTGGRKWSHGFYSKESSDNLILENRTGSSGKPIGKVVRNSDNGFELEVSGSVFLGDRIRIQPKSGEEGPGMTVTRMKAGTKNVTKARKGDRVFLYSNKPVSAGEFVYKVGSAVAGKNKDYTSLPLLEKKDRVILKLHADKNGLNVSGAFGDFNYTLQLDDAKNQGLTSDFLSEYFSTSKDNLYAVSVAGCEVSGNLFFPTSLMKKAKRSFWDWFEENKSESLEAEYIKELSTDHYSVDTGNKTVQPDIYYGFRKKTGSGLKAVALSDSYSSRDQLILPQFCPESRLDKLKKQISDAYDSGVRNFRVTSLYQFNLLKDFNDLTITVGFPFPVTNSAAAFAVSKIGAKGFTVWPELESASAEQLVKSSCISAEIMRSARLPILVTRAALPVTGKISDNRGNKFTIEKKGGLFIVYPEEFLKLPAVNGASNFFEAVPKNGAFKDLNYTYNLQ